jgi:hypothetical protein
MQNALPLPWRREHTRVASSDPALDTLVTDERDDVAESTDHAAAATAARRTVVVRGVDLGSLASLAVRCALVVALSAALAIAGLWYLAASAGAVSNFESFMRSVGFRDFQMSSARIIAGSALLITGLALVIATVIIIAGAVYNLLALNGGGLRVRLVLDDDDHDLAPAERVERDNTAVTVDDPQRDASAIPSDPAA